MLRRRFRTPDLKFERLLVGSESNTAIALCYLQSVVSEELLRKVRANIHKINLKTVFASGYLSPSWKKEGFLMMLGIRSGRIPCVENRGRAGRGHYRWNAECLDPALFIRRKFPKL